MREYTTPLRVTVPDRGNLTDDVVTNATDHPTGIGFARREGQTWRDIDWHTFHSDVVAAAKGLVAAGIGVGDRVALLSRTRYEWTVLDYAIWFAGAVTVPIYETSSDDQIRWILSDSGAHAIVVETTTHRDRVEELRAELPDLTAVWCLDEEALATLAAESATVSDNVIAERRAAVTPESPATLIYTSGTTGRPKGCVLTHGNFMFELTTAVDSLEELFTDDAATLLFLPLAHVFARIIEIGCVKARVKVGHSSDVKNLIPDLKAFQPTFLLAVPRVFEKVFNNASQRATAAGKGALFDRASEAAIAWSQALERRTPSLWARTQNRLFDRLVYRRLRDSLGGRCRYAISGGAPLGDRLGHFYRGCGINVLEGYGLTETTAAITVNVPGVQRVGTVGRPLQGTSIRVDTDGELLVKGGQVFAGYWNDDAASRTAFDEGWFRTGDLGEIDDEGFVKVVGRKKEILVTAGGKNVAPALLEERVRAHPLVDQCIVVGDGRPYIGALVTLDPEALTEWAAQHAKSGDVATLANDPDVHAAIEQAVADANSAVSRAESIRRFTVLDAVWTEEGGQLTPSLKLKRSVVMREYVDEIEALYSRSTPA